MLPGVNFIYAALAKYHLIIREFIVHIIDILEKNGNLKLSSNQQLEKKSICHSSLANQYWNRIKTRPKTSLLCLPLASILGCLGHTIGSSFNAIANISKRFAYILSSCPMNCIC